MGREIRRVPQGWEHPRSPYNGRYIPLYDETFKDAFSKWMTDWDLWQKGEAEFQVSDDGRDALIFAMSYGRSPDPESYRPAWDDAPCYQAYETVSEGTPTSPVFPHLADLAQWLVDQGHSEHATEQFIMHGSAPSFVVSDGQLYSGIDYFGIDKETTT